MKILQNRKMFLQPPRLNVTLSGMVGNTEPRLRKERSGRRARWNAWVLREQSPPGKATVQVGEAGWARPPRSSLRSKDNIHPEPRPLLARWFRRSLGICSSVNYPVLPSALLLW